MIRFNTHSLYDLFPYNHAEDGEPFIECYNDSFVEECKHPGCNIALLLEPRSLLPNAYKYTEEHADLFRYIFTHDSKLLRLPQARWLNWADVWLTTDSDKTKGISLCTSSKDWCPLHKARLELAEYFKDRPEVDVFHGDGSFKYDKVKLTYQPEEYLEHYRYSIIIENDIDEMWFTEKLLNCFSTKTVPIYVGARGINALFNVGGMIRVEDWHSIPYIVENLDVISYYESRRKYIEDNFRRVEQYKTPWPLRFMNDYKYLLEGLINEQC